MIMESELVSIFYYITSDITSVQFNIRSIYKIKMFKIKPWSVHSVFKQENLQYIETLNNKCLELLTTKIV